MARVEEIYAPYGRWKNLVWWFEHWLEWLTATPAGGVPDFTTMPGGDH